MKAYSPLKSWGPFNYRLDRLARIARYSDISVIDRNLSMTDEKDSAV
jgi:hypothetical protein